MKRPALSLLLLGSLVMAAPAMAQLEPLRKVRPPALTTPAEAPMVEIPAGDFVMGVEGTQALEDERPSRRVWLDAFAIDRH